MDSNEKEGVCYPQPTTMKQRLAIANDFTKRFHYDVPLAVEALGDGGPATKAVIHGARAVCVDGRGNTYVCEREGNAIRKVDEKGTIVYKGKPGAFGYHPEEVETWLAKRFPG